VVDKGKASVLGVRVSMIDYEAAVASVIEAAKAKRAMALTALAVHGVMTGVLDSQQRYRLNHLDLVVPDGQPVRWALNALHGARLPDRVYGPNLMLRVCAEAADQHLPVFFYGSTTAVLDRLTRNVEARFPRLEIAGARSSAFRRLSPAEKNAIQAEIRASGAAIVLVGLGCPRQETWAYEYRDALSMPILAVGAAFDFHAGSLSQAPSVLQRLGLEWAFRLAHEPRRLWRRYLFLNPSFLGLLALQAAGVLQFDPTDDAAPLEELRYG
jgi:N-acetylglucosaminyldiphosphoundecaprenol N-acetyl-beta-D-mannosaminyltransferase